MHRSRYRSEPFSEHHIFFISIIAKYLTLCQVDLPMAGIHAILFQDMARLRA